jgi:hypothetical protein
MLDGPGSIPGSAASRPTLGPTQPTIQWVLGALSTSVKRLEREADHLPTHNVDDKICGAIPPLHAQQITEDDGARAGIGLPLKHPFIHASTPPYVFMA